MKVFHTFRTEDFISTAFWCAVAKTQPQQLKQLEKGRPPDFEVGLYRFDYSINAVTWDQVYADRPICNCIKLLELR